MDDVVNGDDLPILETHFRRPRIRSVAGLTSPLQRAVAGGLKIHVEFGESESYVSAEAV